MTPGNDLDFGDFMLMLPREEIQSLSQIVISSRPKHEPNVLALTDQELRCFPALMPFLRSMPT